MVVWHWILLIRTDHFCSQLDHNTWLQMGSFCQITRQYSFQTVVKRYKTPCKWILIEFKQHTSIIFWQFQQKSVLLYNGETHLCKTYHHNHLNYVFVLKYLNNNLCINITSQNICWCSIENVLLSPIFQISVIRGSKTVFGRFKSF